MSISLSRLVDKIKPSFTLQMTARAAALRAKGVDVINFGVGEPDFNTPAHIIEAGQKAMDDGYTKYTPGSGMLELKEAIIHCFLSCFYNMCRRIKVWFANAKIDYIYTLSS
jgi:aspartate aminotransferase